MAFTFKGTYTKNRGDAVAAGTVDIVSKRGATLDTATLDEDGSYELVISAEEGEVTVIETLDGVEVRSYPVSVSRGSTTDTSRDIGYVGPGQSGASDLSAYEGESISLTATGDMDMNADQVRVNVTGSGGVGIFSASEDSSSGITIEDTGTGDVTIQTDGDGQGVIIAAQGAGGTVNITAEAISLTAETDALLKGGSTVALGLGEAGFELVGGNIDGDNHEVRLRGGMVLSGTVDMLTDGATGTFLGGVVLAAKDGGGDMALGFYDGTAVPQPVVPITSPTIQDVIDALTALNLINQTD